MAARTATAKKVVVSNPEMLPVEADSVVLKRTDTPEKRAAKALGVDLVGLARDRVLSRTWRVQAPGDNSERAMVIVTERASAEDREIFARIARDLLAAGDSLPGVLRPAAVSPDQDAYLTDLLTTGSARDLSALQWPPRRRAEFVLEAARALARLHALGIVHGGLCAADVLLDDALHPVLAEVGAVPVHSLIARGVDASLYAAFSAPEVKMGAEADVRADVYSMGRVLEDAMKGTTLGALAPILRKSTSFLPDTRYGSVADMIAEAEAVLDQLPEADVPAPSDARSRPTVRPSTRYTERPPPRATKHPTARPAGHATKRPTERPAILPTKRPTEAPVAADADAVAAVEAKAPQPSPARRRWLSAGGPAVLSVAILALVVVLDPVAPLRAAIARRGLHGDPAAQRAAVAEIVRLGRDFRGTSLANLDLSGLDLSGADLRGVNLSHANLAHTRLFAAEVHGATLDGAQLAGADLQQVVLGLADVGSATCDAETRLPREWRCREGRIERIP